MEKLLLRKADLAGFVILANRKERKKMAAKAKKASKQIFIGIDPGLTGAIAVLNSSGACVFLSDCPTEKKSSKKVVSPEGISQLIAEIKKLRGRFYALLEEPIAMPRNGCSMGASSMLSFGRGAGIWEGALSMAKIEFDTALPSVWKRNIFKKSGSSKEDAIRTAKKLFPTAKKSLRLIKHHGRAEALLLALYLLRTKKEQES